MRVVALLLLPLIAAIVASVGALPQPASTAPGQCTTAGQLICIDAHNYAICNTNLKGEIQPLAAGDQRCKGVAPPPSPASSSVPPPPPPPTSTNAPKPPPPPPTTTPPPPPKTSASQTPTLQVTTKMPKVYTPFDAPVPACIWMVQKVCDCLIVNRDKYKDPVKDCLDKKP
jgi:hypothetical protein